MSAPVHYDVEVAVANFLAASNRRFAQLQNEPSRLTPRLQVSMRHRALAADLLRLTLEEANRSTHPNDTLGAVIDTISEFFVNFAQIWPERERHDVASQFIGILANTIAHGLAIDTTMLPTADIAKTQGGHA